MYLYMKRTVKSLSVVTSFLFLIVAASFLVTTRAQENKSGLCDDSDKFKCDPGYSCICSEIAGTRACECVPEGTTNPDPGASPTPKIIPNPNTCPVGQEWYCESPAVIMCVNHGGQCAFPMKFTGWQEGDPGLSCNQMYPNQNGKQFCQTNCFCGVQSTPTSEPAPKGQCNMTKVYTSNWVELNPDAFKALSAGVQVYFCVNGVSSPLGLEGINATEIFDAGRFTINGILRNQTSLKRPNTNDFCDLYTIPASTYTFKVQGEIHHTVLGWL